eukprot:8478450-Alexandrium_andersonii.AAC.1
MSASLVGSEMCIRDSPRKRPRRRPRKRPFCDLVEEFGESRRASTAQQARCLLYTSDAADDM